MFNIIIIHSLGGREHWLRNSLESLKGYDNRYPIYIFISDPKTIEPSFQSYLDSLKYPVYRSEERWETAAIRYINRVVHPDQFVYLHDSIEIKNDTIFDLCFDPQLDNQSVYFFHRFTSYAGKFRREALSKIYIPLCLTKAEACINEDKDATPQYESFMREYWKIEKTYWLFPGLNDTGVFEHKFGRKNMIIENEYLRKYKGTWAWNMIREDE